MEPTRRATDRIDELPEGTFILASPVEAIAVLSLSAIGGITLIAAAIEAVWPGAITSWI